MRVLPFGSVATSNSARSTSAPVAGLEGLPLIGWKICVHVLPASFERQMPRAKNEAYTVFGSDGSMMTRRAPRGEHGVSPRNTWVGVLPVQSEGAPCETSCHDWPESVERQSPKCGAPGMFAPRSTPLQHTLEMPREPWARVATKMTLEWLGCTAMEPIPRPANESLPMTPLQWVPPSVERERPTPPRQPPRPMVGSPLPPY